NLMEEERLEDFERNIELASYFGCKYIITSTGEAHFGKGEVFADDVLVKNIKRILPKLEEHKITMVLEVHGQYGTGESLYHITKAVDSPYVAVNYDTANVVFYGGKYPEQEIKSCVQGVKYVHLKDKDGDMKDWNFPAVGSGKLKLAEFMEYMDSVSYSGPYSIEIEYIEDFCMRDKVAGDLKVANQAMKDSYCYLKSIHRI
ncbi:MAG: sugar phosphate isomerase/epimerase, partial [Christensenellaceae bacterium]